MTPFADFARLCRRLRATGARLEKRRLTAEFLGRLAQDEIGAAVAFLTGRAFPPSDPRVLGVGALPHEQGVAAGPPLTLMDVAATFAAVAETAGSGARRARAARLGVLVRRASADEREIHARIVGGEMRTGVSEGLVLGALAAMAGGELPLVRRAALFLGDLSAVAVLLASGGAAALTTVSPRPFVPLPPMLAEIATDFGDVLAVHGGLTALDFKYNEVQKSPTYASELALRFARIARIRDGQGAGAGHHARGAARPLRAAVPDQGRMARDV